MSGPTATATKLPATKPAEMFAALARLYHDDERGWGSLPVLLLSVACGLAFITIADAISRTGRPHGEPLFWLGIALVVAPIAWRVTSSRATRTERVFLIIVVGLALYAVKVVHDPFGYTFADELVHQHNVNEILRTGSLFGDNTVLPITPLYPGLEALTAAVASLTGLSSFTAGLLVIGGARVLIILAIYLMVEALSSSTRAGAVGALFFAAGPNFLFFSGQFSYESLALPMSAAVLFTLVAMRSSEDERISRGWGVLGLVMVPAIAATHHVSAYMLTLALLFISAASLVMARRRRRHPERTAETVPAAPEPVAPVVSAPIEDEHPQLGAARAFAGKLERDDAAALIGAWQMATGGTDQPDPVAYLAWIDRPTKFADEIIDRTAPHRSWRTAFSLRSREPFLLTAVVVACVGFWVAVVARRTTGYLSPVLTQAIDLTFKAAAKDAPTRALFKSDSGVVSPQWERAIALLSVVVLFVWLMIGLRMLWKRLFKDAVLFVLTCAALAYLGTLPLRVIPAAWESAIRASSFLFVGVALLAAQARPRFRPGGIGRVRLTIVVLSATIMISGGIIAGWPSNLRLSSPYRINAAGTTIDPPGAGAAQWAKDTLGPGNRMGAEPTDARLLLADGGQAAVAGVFPDIDDVLHSPTLEDWQPGLLLDQRLHYLVVDRRKISNDVLAGYFFAPAGSAADESRPPEVVDKFEAVPWADRIFDNGQIVIYDIHRLADAPPPP